VATATSVFLRGSADEGAISQVVVGNKIVSKVTKGMSNNIIQQNKSKVKQIVLRNKNNIEFLYNRQIKSK